MNAEEQASLWAARCEGSDLTAADRDSLKAWLAEDPEHAVLLAEYSGVSSILRQELPALAVSGSAAWLSTPPAPVQRARIGWFYPVLAAAAAIAVAVFISQRASRPETIATLAGQRRTVVLADGSHVELNAGTTLRVAEGGRERRVQLSDGEAFFAVAKDHGRPFLVETSAGTVRVTGTKFDVCSETPAELQVTVAEGSVQVRPNSGAAPVILKAGDSFSADQPAAVRRLSAAELTDALAWREGQIVFEGASMQQALSRFAHYYRRDIRAAADVANAPDLRVGGRHSLDDLDGFLAGLETMMPVRVVRYPNGAIRVTRRAEP